MRTMIKVALNKEEKDKTNKELVRVGEMVLGMIRGELEEA